MSIKAAVVLTALAATTLPARAQIAIGGGAIAGLYQKNCMQCHAAEGQGGPKAKSLLDDEWLKGGSYKEQFEAVKSGHAGIEGAPSGLSDPENWALVAYILELRYQERRKRLGSPKPDAAGIYTSQHAKFSVETVVDRGLTIPWSMDFLPDGRMLITNRPGALLIYSSGSPGGQLSDPIAGTPDVRDRGQGGLMDVAVHPDFAKNGWIYLSYSDRRRDGGKDLGMTRVVRGKLGGTAEVPEWTEQETIWEAKPEHYLTTDLHFGSKFAFGPAAPDGRRTLFFGIGERGMADMAQDLKRPNGKIHRVWDDGKIPDDNPFTKQSDAYASIWSFGHRNPQGLTFDLAGNLWDTEHGPRGGDELNQIEKGRNFGWPLISFGMNYDGRALVTPWPKEGQDLALPVDVWLPSIGACGLDIARGDAFPGWKGDILAGGLSGANVDRIRVKDGKRTEHEELLHGMGRVRDICNGPDGSVYVVLNDPHKIIRLLPVK